MQQVTSTLILASASPRRRELLASLGLFFEVEAADVDETFLKGEAYSDATLRLARAKARAIAERNPSAFVLAADTIVVDHGTLLAKPRDAEEAYEMLMQLQGRSHIVATGCALVCSDRRYEELFHVETSVSFKVCSEAEIRAYCATGEPLDKAGAYGIQGYGAFLVRSIEGSYTNVVGLPLAEVADRLSAAGVWRVEDLGTIRSV